MSELEYLLERVRLGVLSYEQAIDELDCLDLHESEWYKAEMAIRNMIDFERSRGNG